MTNPDSARDNVLRLLSDCGVEAHAIPEREIEQPDIRAVAGADVLVIEVKTKEDAPEVWKSIQNTLALGKPISLSQELKTQRKLQTVLHTARNQLRKYEGEEDRLNLVWIICESWDAEGQFEDWLCTSYGTACIFDRAQEPRTPNTGSVFDIVSVEYDGFRCDYFHESGFFKYRDTIDGALLQVGNRRILVVNDKSEKSDRLFESRFAETVPTAVVHARKRPIDGPKRYYADCDNDRNDVAATLKFIGEQYGLREPNLIPMQRHTVIARFQDTQSPPRQA